jgi:hypothetical protein
MSSPQSPTCTPRKRPPEIGSSLLLRKFTSWKLFKNLLEERLKDNPLRSNSSALFKGSVANFESTIIRTYQGASTTMRQSYLKQHLKTEVEVLFQSRKQ